MCRCNTMRGRRALTCVCYFCCCAVATSAPQQLLRSDLTVRKEDHCASDCTASSELNCFQCASPTSGQPDWSCSQCCKGFSLEGPLADGFFCEKDGPEPTQGTYGCYDSTCYDNFGTQTKDECEKACGGGGGGGGDFLCYSGQCYEGKGTMSKAECNMGCAPGPPPGSPDSWVSYEVGGMSVQSVTGGKDTSKYDKVCILLHGGSGSGTDWLYQYQQGWFGNLTGIKYVFPTSPDHLWYHSYKNGCGLLDDCSYDIPSINTSASRVAELIEHEMGGVGSNSAKVFLGGFSQGAQMTGYMQLVHLKFALGGVFVMDGFPLPPLQNMPGQAPTAAKKNASYYGQDMRWIIWQGTYDTIFTEPLTSNTWRGIFAALEIESTLDTLHIESGMTHTVIEEEFRQLVAFVRGESTGNGQCAPRLDELCASARAASVGNCFVCAGTHQSQIKKAKCTEADIDNFCSRTHAHVRSLEK